MGVRGERARIVRRWLPIAVACLAVLLLPLPGVGAAEESAGADDPASDAQAATETGPDDSAGGVEVVRYAGSDQYELSLAVAQALVDAEGGASEWVVLASGESWAEAASAGPLAASLGAPVVLVPPGGLQTAAARPDLVGFLRSSGVRRVVIVGGADVLPNHEPSVLYGLGMLPRNIERVHGEDAIGTSVAIAERLDTPAELGELGRTVIIASGRSIADAVAVGPIAALGPFPLLLTAPDELDTRIAAYLTDQEIEHVVLVGGAAAMAPAVHTAIETAGATVTRLAGRDRSDTARLAADLFRQHTADESACTGSPIRIGLVPAQHPEQALTAGPQLAQQCAALRYTEPDQLPADLRNTLYLSRDLPPGVHVAVFGADDDISDAVLGIDTPPVVFAAFNFRLNADRRSLDGILEVIDDSGRKRLFPQTRMTRQLEDGLPPDWRNQLQSEQRLVIDYWAGVRWSHDGEWLAYRGIDGESLFGLNVHSGELRRIDPNGHRVVDDAIGFTFHWSPVANKLAFSAVVEDETTLSDPDLTPGGTSEFTSELFVYDVESGDTVRLTNNNFRDSAGPWSPDGSHLAFAQTPSLPSATARFGHVAYRRLMVQELATRKSVTVHSDYVLNRVNGGGAAALWSPDGRRLAFVAIPGGDPFTTTEQLHIATLDGGEPIVLRSPDCDDCVTSPALFPLPDLWVDGWSPLGGSIAYSAQFHADGLALVQDIEGGDARETFRLRSKSKQDGTESFSRYIGWTANGQALLYLRSLCHYLDGYSTAEMEVIEVSRDGSRSSVVLDVPSRLGDRHASCVQDTLLSPDRRSIALRDSQLGMQVARFSDGDWKRLLNPAQRQPGSFFDTYNCRMNWVGTGIRIGCAHTIGDY